MSENDEGGYCEWKFQGLKVAIVSENFKGSGILVLQWQRYNFSNIQKM